VGRTLAILVTAIFFVHAVVAQQIYVTHTGKAAFVSDAPLEVIKAESNEVNGAVNLADRTFAFTIDNSTFKGFNSSLQQEHFYENYMETQLYPTSSFKGKIIEEIDPNSTKEQVVRAKGILDIHGVSQERIIKGTLKKTGDKIEIRADFTVLLQDHQIKIPRVVYQKIAEVINVSILTELTRKTQ
jgi:polyisoprenoid-binding protein YceI